MNAQQQQFRLIFSQRLMIFSRFYSAVHSFVLIFATERATMLA
jgi:hypothetical protein